MKPLSNAELLIYLRHRCVVEDEDGCWVWTGALNDHGTPSFWLRGTQCFARNARAAAYFCSGEVKVKGHVFARPHCDERCIRPEHQIYVTRRAAMALAKAAGRLSAGYLHAASVIAARRKNRKVTDDVVAAMRQRYATTGNAALVAREFGVHHSYAHRICTYRIRAEGNVFAMIAPAGHRFRL